MFVSISIILLASAAYASPIFEARQNQRCISTTLVTVTRVIEATYIAAPAETLVVSDISSPPISSSTSSSESAIVTAPALEVDPAASNPTTPVPVSGAGGVLNPTAAAEANQFDEKAVRTLKGVRLQSSTGQCLFIDPTAGDFRQNIIPVAVRDCTGSPGENFDFVTAGRHNDDTNGATLIVSSLMNGCLSFDPRRTVNAAHVFSCGGRADGQGDTSNSQLFPFSANETSLTIAPENENGQTCLVNVNGLLNQAACNGDASQIFIIA